MTIKRFIAGAVCPRCSTMDSIQTYTENGIKHRVCVDCGFTDTDEDQNSKNELTRSLIPTRVIKVNSESNSEKQQKTAQTLKFYPNPKLKK